jgi:photosynthetic reaction center cytochrome c subunit
MARDLNTAYMEPLTSTFPEHRLGPTGDVAKTNCTTCHQGAFKPMYGRAMAKDYPGMKGAPSPALAASAPELVAQDAAAPAVEVAAQ